MIPNTVPNKPTNGASGTDGCQAADAALQFGVNNGFGAFQSAARSFNIFTRDFRAHLVSLEFLQTSHNHFGQVALVEAVGNLDGFIQLAFAQAHRPRPVQTRAIVCGRRCKRSRDRS
jgi:hypothetical protein